MLVESTWSSLAWWLLSVLPFAVGVMAQTSSVQRTVERWSRRAGQSQQDYESGVRGTARSWSAASAAADGNYRAGVTAAASAGRYGTRVRAAGDERWKSRALAKGAMRYGPGVDASRDDYATAIGPVLDAIGRVDLPARGPVGSDGNYARSAAIGRALRQLRTGTAR